jgi:anthranilate phosphoribosyltransferase
MSLRKVMRVLGPGRKDGRNLTFEEAHDAFASILSGGESEVAIAAFLVLMRMKGLTVQELTAFARAARERATIPCQDMAGLVSICPPHDGMDRFPPLEVASALIAAGAGVRVMLFTDRCVPPKRGLTGASVLQGLGVGLTWDPHEAESWVEKTGFGAVAVSGMLPALMGLRRVRDEVAMRTPLSTVEKLLAPNSSALVLGAMGGPVLGTAAEVMQALGHPRGLVVQGPEGGVVPGIVRRTRGIELCERHLVPLNVEPEDFGLGQGEEPELPLFCPLNDEQGTGDNPALVRIVGEMTEEILSGAQSGGRSAALLCAALVLKASGRALTLAEGVDAATHSLDTGAAREVLDRLRALR